MKSYVTDHQIRLVGKAWEVKRCLHVMLQNVNKEVTLRDYVNQMLTKQPLLGNMQDPQVIPFPSK
ncbi:hypothetical protein D3C87_2132660 [compost metagenome]